MIGSVLYWEWPLCVASVVFYVCILMPLRQVKNAVLIVLGRGRVGEDEESSQVLQPYLSVCKLEDSSSESEEMCSICLVEFDKGEVVSRLSRCGHVFHMDCIDRWIDCNHFTCPLCRSFLLINVPFSHAKCPPPTLSC